jgi:hypothetical protein
MRPNANLTPTAITTRIGTPTGARGALRVALLFLAVGACTVLGSPSRVRAGQLYAVGSARYDAYFVDVHAQQVAAASWQTERKSARKPLLDALKLQTDADDAIIEQSTKDRLSTGGLRLDVQGTDVKIVEAAAKHENPQEVLAAVEVAAHAEIERVKKLSDMPAKLAQLTKTGQDLENHIAEDFAGAGQKPFEVQEELHASYDVLADLASTAAREKKDGEQFVAELGRAVSAGSEVPGGGGVAPPAVVATVRTKPVKGGAASTSAATVPAATPASRTEAAPKPPKATPVARSESSPPKPAKPAAKAAEAEVFNP